MKTDNRKPRKCNSVKVNRDDTDHINCTPAINDGNTRFSLVKSLISLFKRLFEFEKKMFTGDFGEFICGCISVIILMVGLFFILLLLLAFGCLLFNGDPAAWTWSVIVGVPLAIGLTVRYRYGVRPKKDVDYYF